MFNAWQQWWTRDSVQSIPPIYPTKLLNLKFLDDYFFLTGEEMYKRT